MWAAFREFQQLGFQKADLDRILGQAGVTKGALYHHYESKRGLGYSVVTESSPRLDRRPMAAAPGIVNRSSRSPGRTGPLG